MPFKYGKKEGIATDSSPAASGIKWDHIINIVILSKNAFFSRTVRYSVIR